MDDDGWDLHAVVRSCTTSATVSSAAAVVVHEGRGAEQSLPTAGTAAVTTISFDDGRSAHEQQSTSTNLISFSMQPVDSKRHVRKRRSRNNKRIVEMREEELSNDGWAWRKYGQKPIKGSPYPRCSTIKGCSARKQVERSPVDASKFIVSYFGDHLHPGHTSTLAEAVRSTKCNDVATDLVEQTPSSSSPASNSSFSPTTSFKEDETEKNDNNIQEVNFW